MEKEALEPAAELFAAAARLPVAGWLVEPPAELLDEPPDPSAPKATAPTPTPTTSAAARAPAVTRRRRREDLTCDVGPGRAGSGNDDGVANEEPGKGINAGCPRVDRSGPARSVPGEGTSADPVRGASSGSAPVSPSCASPGASLPGGFCSGPCSTIPLNPRWPRLTPTVIGADPPVKTARNYPSMIKANHPVPENLGRAA